MREQGGCALDMVVLGCQRSQLHLQQAAGWPAAQLGCPHVWVLVRLWSKCVSGRQWRCPFLADHGYYMSRAEGGWLQCPYASRGRPHLRLVLHKEGHRPHLLLLHVPCKVLMGSRNMHVLSRRASGGGGHAVASVKGTQLPVCGGHRLHSAAMSTYTITLA